MFDDIADLGAAVFDRDTYATAFRPVATAARLAANAGFSSLARGTGPLGLGIRGADYAVDQFGIPLPPGVRAELRDSADSARAGRFGGGVVTLDAPADQTADTSARATDNGSEPPAADTIRTGVFDP